MGTLTTSIRLSKPTIGGDLGPIWPNELNSDMDYTDQAVNQTVAVPVPDTNVTLVADGGSTDQARYHVYNFTGALTADRTATLPNVQRQGWATNSTTGGFNILLSAGGVTATLPPDGAQYMFVSDGSTNVSLVPVGFGTVAISSTLKVNTTNADPAGNGVPGMAVGTASISIWSNSTGGAIRVANSQGPVGPLLEFFNGIGGNVGNIATNGVTTSYNTTSDERLKIKDGLIAPQWAAALIRQMQPQMFRWKTKPDRQAEPGFFAQELNSAYPWAVTEGRGEPGEQDFCSWKIDQAKLMPVVISVLQMLILRIEALEGGSK